MRGCHLQKRKHEDEDEVWQQYPTWVTCMNSLILFNKGIFPPAEVKLSKEASPSWPGWRSSSKGLVSANPMPDPVSLSRLLGIMCIILGCFSIFTWVCCTRA